LLKAPLFKILSIPLVVVKQKKKLNAGEGNTNLQKKRVSPQIPVNLNQPIKLNIKSERPIYKKKRSLYETSSVFCQKHKNEKYKT